MAIAGPQYGTAIIVYSVPNRRRNRVPKYSVVTHETQLVIPFASRRFVPAVGKELVKRSLGRASNQPLQNCIEVCLFFGTDTITTDLSMRHRLEV
jgi:hypothetical protein